MPRSPTKDKYIDLQDRGGGGDMVDGGFPQQHEQPGGGKPKKVIYEVVVWPQTAATASWPPVLLFYMYSVLPCFPQTTSSSLSCWGTGLPGPSLTDQLMLNIAVFGRTVIHSATLD